MRSSDLDLAVNFAINRIEEEARSQNAPLNEDERSFLHNLPTETAIAMLSDPHSSVLTARDAPYEKLCTLGKAAYKRDIAANSATKANWEFSAAVCAFSKHPMSWLLQATGVKVRKPWWDRWLLVVAALLFVGITFTCFILAGEGPWDSVRWIAVGSTYLALVAGMFFVSRRLQGWQLMQAIERSRATSSLK